MTFAGIKFDFTLHTRESNEGKTKQIEIAGNDFHQAVLCWLIAKRKFPHCNVSGLSVLCIAFYLFHAENTLLSRELLLDILCDVL